MTYEQFAKYASGFKNHSDSIDDGWIINELHNAMVKQCKILFYY